MEIFINKNDCFAVTSQYSKGFVLFVFLTFHPIFAFESRDSYESTFVIS